MKDRKVVLGNLSNTQRLTVLNKDNGLVIQKEWRKTQEEMWRVNKGIEVPLSCISKLKDILSNY